MTTEIELTTFARARVSRERRPELRLQSRSGVLSREMIGRSPHAERFVSIEAFVPHGAMAGYGLLGISFEPRDTEGLRIEVGYDDTLGERWSSALAGKIDDVRAGLPGEYAAEVLEGLTSGVPDDAPRGTLAVVEAAHGLVGSSNNLFRRIAAACVRVLLQAEAPDDDEAVADLLRRVLLARSV